jgi:hypothetical protein
MITVTLGLKRGTVRKVELLEAKEYLKNRFIPHKQHIVMVNSINGNSN